MEIHFSKHALRRLQEMGVAGTDIQEMIERSAPRAGRRAVFYQGIINGVLIRAIVTATETPSTVITVYYVWAGEEN